MSLPLRSLLVYPNGANPGYDPTHIASQGGGIRFSGVAGPYGAIRSLLNPAPPGVTSTNSAIVSTIGNVVRFGPVSTTSYNTFVGRNETPTSMTFATIFVKNTSGTAYCMFVTNGGSVAYNDPSQVWLYGSTVSNNVGLWVGGGLVSLPNSGVISSLAPMFLALSFKNGGPLWGIIRNLQTGQIYLSSAASGATIGTSTQAQYCVGGSPFGAFSGSNIATIMYAANTYLGPAQLSEWAQDPWAFWYPSKLGGLMSAAATVAAAGGGTTQARAMVLA